jgi:hypothetical protein
MKHSAKEPIVSRMSLNIIAAPNLRSLVVPDMDQKPPSITRVAAGAFGFLTLIQLFDGPERLGTAIFF